MISNERQYRITKAEAEKFKQAINELEKAGPTEGIHPRLFKAQRDAMQSQLDEMLEEIAEYEQLRTGKVQVLKIDSFDALAEGLIKARIAAGLSQKDLADRLKLKEQQIQRYEADRYASASFQRLQEVARAIGVEIRKEILLPLAANNVDSLLAKLGQAGLDRDFIKSKLLATSDVAHLDGSVGEQDDEKVVAKTADVASRIFGWSRADLFSPPPLAAPQFAAAVARFKLPAGRRQRSTSLYAAYANYLAVAVVKGCESLPRKAVPSDAAQFRDWILRTYNEVTLKSALHCAWDLGIPVLPLRDRGTFHGACWRYESRNVIVLKQASRFQSRWLFDLLHEIFHASQNPEQDTLEIIEADENSPERRNSEEEIAASQFAGDVLLQGRAEEFAQACVAQANGAVERLKSVVPDVAKKFDVDLGAAANYLAYRLSWQDINWWGAASNLQKEDGSPWEVARDVFLERFPFKLDNELDRQLLTRALQ